VLKARALIGLNRYDDAKSLLIKQIQGQPSDVGSLQLLAKTYQRESDWQKVLPVAQRLSQLAPTDTSYGLMTVEAAFRSGNIGEGRAASMRLLKRDASPETVSSVLALWEDYWPSPQRIADAQRLGGNAASLQGRLVYASFLNRLGSPADGARLSSPAAKLPIDASNVEANAVLADAWWRMGNIGPGKSRLDAVLAFDPGNATALRGRAELNLRLHNPQAAIVDAQKLTTVLTSSADDRLLLARSYAAAGNDSWVDRTLWSAFQDIPGDDKLLTALEARRKGNADATRELQEEFDRQRDAKLGRGLL
jgi:tetratricopeptide (TPR) repeat protein